MVGKAFVIRISILSAACFTILSVPVWAQLTTGTIAGSVTDISGAVIPSASLRVTNVDTGIVKATKTDKDGLYTVTSLRPGHYIVEARLSDGLPIPAPDLANPSGDITYIPPNEPPTYVQFWNLDIQRALPASFLLDIAYSGSRGVHLPGVVNLNQAPPGPGSPSTRAPISASINSLNALLNYASSSYNSLQVKVERHFSKGFYLLCDYTYSRSMDNDSADSSSDASNASSGEPQNSFDWAAEYAPSDFDVPQRFVASYVYELPFGRGQRFLASSDRLVNAFLGGWQVNGITTVQSGSPFTPIVANPTTNAGSGGAIRPNRIGNGQIPASQRSVNHWFNVADFVVPPPFHFGNSGRNVLRGPGLADFDFSLFRHIPITERVNLEFRAEVFNIFNHPNFGLPDASVDTPQAGIITSALDPRQIQFALQLRF